MGESKLPDTEFKAMVKRILMELSENFKSMKNDIESIKKKQSEMKDIATEMKNNLWEINSREDEAKNQISNLEYKEAKTPKQNNKKKKRIWKNEDNVRSLWDNFKQPTPHDDGVPTGKEREQGIENLFEKIMTKIFPNLKKEIDIQVQEVQIVPNKKNPKGPTPRHIIIKM